MLKNKIKNLLDLNREPEPFIFTQPIIITGCMRSGTTLLFNMLSEHPQLLKIGFEINNVWTSIGGAPSGHDYYGECNYRDETDFKAQYLSNMTNYFSEYIEREKSLKSWIMRARFRQTRGSGGINKDWKNIIPLCKSPNLINKLKYINSLYPSSKRIIILRSIYSHSYSQKKHFIKTHKIHDNRVIHLPTNVKEYWNKLRPNDVKKEMKSRLYPGNFTIIPEAWLNMNYLALKEANEIADDKTLVVSFEKLVNNPKESIETIFEFLNLNSKHDKIIPKIINKKRKLLTPTSGGDPISIWKTGLNEGEKRQIEAVIQQNQDKYDFIMKHL